MRKIFLAAAALALTSPVVAIAAPVVTVNFGTAPTILSPFNNFVPELAGLGYTHYTTTGSSLVLSGPANITFYFLGSESGFDDRFSTSTLGLTETSNLNNSFATPVLIGSQTFFGGSLAGLLNFTSLSAGGVAATVGDDGFGIFLKSGQTTGTGVTEFIFGYDDFIRGADDNHDDFIVRAVVTSAVPEPGTWAMLLSGFAIVGSLVRRRRSNGVTVLA